MRYRYRIEPTPAQQRCCRGCSVVARVVFNDALRVRDEAYLAGVRLSDSEVQRRVITAAKKSEQRAWLAEVPSVALVQSVNDSRRAWRNFFDSARETTGSQGGSATDEVEKGLPAVVSAYPQRVQRAAEWTVVCGEGGRDAGALVARTSRGAILSHGNPRTRWPLLRQLRRRRTACPAFAYRAGGRGGYGHHPVGHGRHHRWCAHRYCESEALNPQVAEVAAVGAGEVPTAERIEQQGQNAAQGRHSTQRNCSCAAGLSPQAGFGVGSRQPSDPSRKPQHCGHGPKPPASKGDHRCGLGAVHPNHHRKSRPLRAHCASGVALVSIQQDLLGMRLPTRRTTAAEPRLEMSVVCGGPRPRPQRRQSHSRRRAGGETKRLPRKWAGPRQRFRWSPCKTATACGCVR